MHKYLISVNTNVFSLTVISFLHGTVCFVFAMLHVMLLSYECARLVKKINSHYVSTDDIIFELI